MGPQSDGLRVERRGHHTVHLRAGVSIDEVLQALDAPGEVLKESPKRSTKRVGEWVVKTTLPGGGLQLLKHTLQRVRHRQGWKAALHLEARGIGVPAPRAFVERGMLGLIAGNAMISTFLEGCVNVEVHARALVEKGAGEEALTAFVSDLAEAVNALNGTQAFHTDLSGKNILTQDGKAFYFIDLDGVLLGHPYGEDSRMKNHVQLYDSFCDVLDGEILEPFIARMLPPGLDRVMWIERVRDGQRWRRARRQDIWKKQGRT